MNALVKSGSVAYGGNSMVPQTMDQAIRLADLMSRGKLVPQHLQGSGGDCLMVVELAMRWRMSPFAVAQCTSVIKGKLMLEGKLVAAAVETSGALSSLLDYRFEGAGDNRKVIVSATRVGETEPRIVEVVYKDAVTENGIWKKQPDQQLCYHGARVWARRWTPAVMLGVYVQEEMESEAEAVAEPGIVIQGVAEESAGTRDAINADVPLKKRTVTDWLDGLEADLKAAQTPNAVDAIIARDDVQKALDALKGAAKDRLAAIIKAATDRTSDVFPKDLPSGEAGS